MGNFYAKLSQLFFPKTVLSHRKLCMVGNIPAGLSKLYNFPSKQTQEAKVTLRLTVYRQSVRLGDRPLETQGHILPSQSRDSPNLEDQVTVFICPRNWVAGYTPWHWVPFSPLLTTRKATVEVWDPSPPPHGIYRIIFLFSVFLLCELSPPPANK
jgi:hypothetical protein